MKQRRTYFPRARALALLLAVTLLMGTLPVSAASLSGYWKNYGATVYAGGDGTADNPYQIASAEQLALLTTQVNDGDDAAARASYVLTEDIDLDGHYWTPIGIRRSADAADLKPFYGTFDGAGHTISNMIVKENPTDTYSDTFSYYGLFGYADGATLKNIFFDASCMIRPVSASGAFTPVSLDAGMLLGSGTDTTIINCSSAGSIIIKPGTPSKVASFHIGGLVGLGVDTTITNCTNAGSITITATNSVPVIEIFSGGLIGRIGSDDALSLIYGSSNTGAISITPFQAAVRFGGVVGEFGGSNASVVQNCFNAGDLTLNNAYDYYFGGIVGVTNTANMSKTLLQNCYNSGNMSLEASGAGSAGLRLYGGIIGTVLSTSSVIRNTYNTGNMLYQGPVTPLSGLIVGGFPNTIDSPSVYNYGQYDAAVAGSRWYTDALAGSYTSLGSTNNSHVGAGGLGRVEDPMEWTAGGDHLGGAAFSSTIASDLNVIDALNRGLKEDASSNLSGLGDYPWGGTPNAPSFNPITVTYDISTNGGTGTTPTSTAKYGYGDAISLPDTTGITPPADKTDHHDIGWNRDPAATTAEASILLNTASFPTTLGFDTIVTAKPLNATVYAVFPDHLYTITLNAGTNAYIYDANLGSVQTLTHLLPFNAEIPKTSGGGVPGAKYTFIGWRDENGKFLWSFPKVTGDATYTGVVSNRGDTVWIDAPDMYMQGSDTVAGNANDTKVTPSGTYTEDELKAMINADGGVDIPGGGTVTQPGADGLLDGTDDNLNFTVNGPFTVDKDGTIRIPAGSTIKQEPDGAELSGVVLVDPDGTVHVSKPSITAPNIIIPGTDGITGTGDDVTVTPDGALDEAALENMINPDSGVVTVPAPGGKVSHPGTDGVNGTADDEDFTINGSFTVDPDGTIHVPEGSTIKKEPDGTETPGPVLIDPDGTIHDSKPSVTPPAINVPGKDGVSDTADDIVIAPGGNPTESELNGMIDPDTGVVTLPSTGGTVTKPGADGVIGGGDDEETVITGPATVDPDGTIHLPEGSEAELPGGEIISGPATINPVVAPSVFGITMKNGATETHSFVYGDTITIEITGIRRDPSSPIGTFALKQDKVQLFAENPATPGVTSIAEANIVNGNATLSYPTGNKDLTIGTGKNLYVTYGGSAALSPKIETVSFALAQKPLTATVDGAAPAAEKVYDATANFTNIPLTLSGLLSGDTAATATANGAAENANADSAKAFTASDVSLTGTDAVWYSLDTAAVGGNVKITPMVVTITPDANQSKTYNNTEPSLTYTSAPALLGSDSFSGELGRASGEGVGTYEINLGTLTAGGNYSLAVTPGVTFEIVKAPGAAITTPITGNITGDGTEFTYTMDAILGAEYSADGTNWQDSPSFIGYTAGNSVTFYARMKADANHEAGAPSDTGAVTFDLLTKAENPTLHYEVSGSTGSKTITITPAADCEYTFDGGATWTTSNTATFTSDSSQEVGIRYKETATHQASAGSMASVDLTNQEQSAPAAFTLTFEDNNNGTFTATIPPIAGGEYSFDGASWSSVNTKNDCLKTTAYTGYVRLAATPGYNASPVTSDTQTTPDLPVTAPVITPNGGTFLGSQTVSIESATAGATIYYTVDGSVPTSGSMVYSAPFILSDSAQVSTIAVKEHYTDSAVVSARFTKQATGSGGGGSDSSAVTTYTVTFVGYDGATLKTQTVARNRSATAPAAPDREGYTFTGWDKSFEKVTASITVTALYTKNKEQDKAELDRVNHNAYITGVGSGLFRPNATLSRAEAVTMFSRLLVTVPDENSDNPTVFVDVDKNAWYAQAVTLLARLNIVTGRDNGTFGPEASITRAEFVAIIARLDSFEPGNGALFSDVPDTHWAKDYIGYAAARGWIKGEGDGNFRPDDSISRAEAVTIINRVLGRSYDVSYADTAALNGFTDVPESHWAYADIIEAAIGHDHSVEHDVEKWTGIKN